MSRRKRELYDSGWECVAGRCKKYKYTTKNGNVFSVDGTWELKLCEFLDTTDLIWARNKKRFDYYKKDGKKSTYQPDFYIEDLDLFVEVKGYETDLDKLKWEQFPLKMVVLRKKEIEDLNGWFKNFDFKSVIQ